MGYEYSAEVVEAGADVGRFVPSDKVIQEPTYDHGQCFQVRTVNRTCARTFPSPGSTVTAPTRSTSRSTQSTFIGYLTKSRCIMRQLPSQRASPLARCSLSQMRPPATLC